MDTQTFSAIVHRARERQDDLLLRKGKDYTRHNPDRLANFKEVAEDLGLNPKQVWAVYFSKHIAAILSFIKTGKAESEGIIGRIDDAVNYLYLLEGLIREEQVVPTHDGVVINVPDSVRQKIRQFRDGDLGDTKIPESKL